MRPALIAAISLSAATAAAQGFECIPPPDLPPPPIPCAPVPVFSVGPEVKAPYSCGDARVLFVDFPIHGDAPPPAYAAALRDKLLPKIESIGADLCRASFCDPACHLAAATGLDVQIEAVFGPQPTAPELRRRDGHLRHWRLSIVDSQSGDLIVIAPTAHCAVVDMLRTAAREAATALGVDPVTVNALRVGREACSVRPMAAHPSCDIERLEAAPGADGAPDATIALIDTGVDAGFLGELGVTDEITALMTPSLSDDGTVHLHGTAMAELIRRIASVEAANLKSYRTMTGGGIGVVADVARALDDATTKGDGPTVINLSLGWLPEQGRSRLLRGPACTTTEDDIGEAMRYALSIAAERDTAETPVVVVAAAGNRPLSGENPVAFDVVNTVGFDAWTSDWWTPNQPGRREPMLMPAQYERLDGTLVAVGAVDGGDRRAALSIMPPESEPHLTAPGQFVPFASVEALTSDMTTLSGSSLAAAYTSAAIARTFDALHDRRQIDPDVPAISGAEAAAFVYLLAADVGRAGAAGLPIRRVALDRLDDALACEALTQVLKCVILHAHDRGELLEECSVVEELCHLEPSTPCAHPLSGAEGCEEEFDMIVTEADGSTTVWQDTGGAPMTFGDPMAGGQPDRIDDALLGGVGPSPHIPPCSDCEVILATTTQQLALWMQMTTQYPSGTLFYSPELLLYDAAGDKAKVAVDMGTSALGPGAALWATGPGVPTTLGPVHTAVLVMTVQQPGKPPAVRPSPVAVY